MSDDATDNASLEVLNTSTLTGLIGDDDPALVRKFQVDFLKQAKESMAKIVQFYKINDFDSIKAEAHFLKTSAKAVGAELAGAYLEQMEGIALDEDADRCRYQIVLINDSVKKVYEVILRER